jgi:hypothetical protein
MDLLASHDSTYPSTSDHYQALLQTLTAGQLPSGGIITGHGFASQIQQRDLAANTLDFRDVIPVVGWCDKAFRYLASHVPINQSLPPAALSPYETKCCIRKQNATWHEDEKTMTSKSADKLLYQWQKGSDWVSVSTPEVMWK